MSRNFRSFRNRAKSRVIFFVTTIARKLTAIQYLAGVGIVNRLFITEREQNLNFPLVGNENIIKKQCFTENVIMQQYQGKPLPVKLPLAIDSMNERSTEYFNSYICISIRRSSQLKQDNHHNWRLHIENELYFCLPSIHPSLSRFWGSLRWWTFPYHDSSKWF